MSTSQLESPGDRFLSLCVQYAVEEDWLSPADLTEEFPPTVLMNGLESARKLRAKLLVEAAGVHERIAPKKSTSAAAEDLQIALDEGICTPETVLSLVPIDEMVRHLDSSALWELLIRDQFWLQDSDKSRARMLAMLETGLELELIDLTGLVNSVSPEQLAKDLPRPLLEILVTAAIQSGLEGAAIDPSALMDVVSLETWLEHIPVSHFWETAISSEVLPSAGLTTASPAPAPAPKQSKAEPVEAQAQTNKKKGKSKNKSGAATGPATAVKAKNEPTSADEVKAAIEDVATSSPPPSRSSNDAEEQARTRAVAKLTELDRLPTDAADLRTPVLLGLENVYGEFLTTSADDDRQELLEDAFPNPAMLSEALIAMIVTLDPAQNRDELVSKDHDGDSLIELLLGVERGRSGSKPAATPAPAAKPAVPTPLPKIAKSATTPPPVPGKKSLPPPPPSVGAASIPPPPPGASAAKRGGGIPPLPAKARKASAPPPPLPGQPRNRAR